MDIDTMEILLADISQVMRDYCQTRRGITASEAVYRIQKLIYEAEAKENSDNEK